MCLSFAAADLLEIDEKPHFQESEHGVLTALYTARIRTRLNQTPQYHPYIASCDYLETAAMLSIAGDQDLTERWFEQRNVASSIPAGHYSDEAYHAFHQLVHATIKDLTGLGRNDVKPPCVIAQQTYNVIKAYSGPNKRQVPYSHYRYLLGMKVWAETLGEHRREPNLDRTNIGMSTLDKVVSDLYLTPALSWVRSSVRSDQHQKGTWKNKSSMNK